MNKSKGSKGGPHPIEINRELSSEQGEEVLSILETRFEKQMDRHQGIE